MPTRHRRPRRPFLYLFNAAQTVGPLSGTIADPTDGNTAAIFLSPATTLTVNQTAAGTFQGYIYGGGNLVLEQREQQHLAVVEQQHLHRQHDDQRRHGSTERRQCPADLHGLDLCHHGRERHGSNPQPQQQQPDGRLAFGRQRHGRIHQYRHGRRRHLDRQQHQRPRLLSAASSPARAA